METLRITAMTSEGLILNGKRSLTLNYNPQPIVFVRGEGMYLYDVENKKYLDMIAGVAVCALGHAPPELAEILTNQAHKLWHVSNLYYNSNGVQLASHLVSISFADRVFFANSGAEANEAAIKLARRYMHVTGRPERKTIICAHKSFHGRTLATIAATGQEKYRVGFDPIPGGFSHVNFGDVSDLEKAIDANTCAILLEPVMGEGGVFPAPPGYLKRVRELCDQHKILLILDEVQTGVGRTGSMFAYEQEGIRPDIMTLAKGLGGGIPIGAMLCSNEVAKGWEVGSHNSTFGGNPLATACAMTVLTRVGRPEFLKHVQHMGSFLSTKLTELSQKYPEKLAGERGKGLMRALLTKVSAKKIVERCAARGVLLNAIGEDVLRFVPPLIIGEIHVTEALRVLDEVLADL
jgi:acetylornithine/N-succinyldiaminopimelate aminotransferase